MKIIILEVYKTFRNKLIPAVILISLVANAIMLYEYMTSSGENAFIAQNIIPYNRILDDFKQKPIRQARDELNTLNEELLAFGSIQSLASNLFEQTQEEIDSQLHQINSQQPGIIKRFNDKNYRLYSGSIDTDSNLVSAILGDVNYINGYGDYIKSMPDRMSEMLSVSVFYQKGSFAYRNIVKTPLDFSPLQDISLKLDISAGIVNATDFGLTDVFVLCIVSLLCICLIAIDKDTKLLALYKTTMHGRGRLIYSKLFTLLLSSGALTLLFYGSNIFIAQYVFGLGDLGRYVQSIPEFRGCTILLTVGQYLTIFLLQKALAVMLLSLITFVVMLLSSNSVYAYIGVATVFIAEWVAWRFIPATSFVNHLKFINLFGFLDVFTLCTNYQNINIFGQPVNARLIFLVVVPACIIALAVLCRVAFTRVGYDQKDSLFMRLLDQFKMLLGRIPVTASLFCHELYRILVTQKALVILILLAALQYSSVSGYSIAQDSDQTIYQHYLKQINGELTDKTRAYIAQEQAKFDRTTAEITQASDDLRDNRITTDEYNGIVARNSVLQERATAFGWVNDQYRYLYKLSGERGIRAWFVDPRGYSQLFSLNGYNNDLLNGLLFIVVCIACFAATLAQDNSVQTKRILIACKEGRGRDIIRRYLACYLVVIVVAILVYGTQFLIINQWYDLSGWDAPVQSVVAFQGSMITSVHQFSNFPLNITIGQYALVMYGIRLLGIIAVVSAILLVSSLTDRVLVSIFASTAVLAIPSLFYFLGFTNAKYLSLITPLSANMLLAENLPVYALASLPVLMLSFSVCILYIAGRAYYRSE